MQYSAPADAGTGLPGRSTSLIREFDQGPWVEPNLLLSFNLPITVATLDLTAGGLKPLIHHLGSAS